MGGPPTADSRAAEEGDDHDDDVGGGGGRDGDFKDSEAKTASLAWQVFRSSESHTYPLDALQSVQFQPFRSPGAASHARSIPASLSSSSHSSCSKRVNEGVVAD